MADQFDMDDPAPAPVSYSLRIQSCCAGCRTDSLGCSTGAALHAWEAEHGWVTEENHRRVWCAECAPVHAAAKTVLAFLTKKLKTELEKETPDFATLQMYADQGALMQATVGAKRDRKGVYRF